VIDPRDIRTVFMGTPEFALAAFEGLLDFGLNLVAVYTQPDRPSGRGNRAAISRRVRGSSRPSEGGGAKCSTTNGVMASRRSDE
jgi:hypothetical protein